jgi:alcohol/geraniol dehydrogenase (NADP+)
MALQFLNKWGCDVTAFTSTAQKADEARRMGAHHVIDTHSADALAKARGSFDFILSTVNADLNWDGYIAALAPKGRLHVVGAVPNPLSCAGVFGLLVGTALGERFALRLARRSSDACSISPRVTVSRRWWKNSR